jgi:hypothetical protein
MSRASLHPRYIGPFKILHCRGAMSYKLELPPKMSEVHDVCHVSQLHKCLQPPNKPQVFKDIDHNSIDLSHDLTYREIPVRILEEDVRLTRRRKIKMYKVQWSNPLKMKLHGNTRIISRKNFQAYSALNY